MKYPSSTSATPGQVDPGNETDSKIIREEIIVALGLWGIGLIPLAIVYVLFVS